MSAREPWGSPAPRGEWGTRMGWKTRAWCAGVIVSLSLAVAPVSAMAAGCLKGTALEVAADEIAIRTTRTAIEAFCPCAAYDGSADLGTRAYKRCAKTIIDSLIDAGGLRQACRKKLIRLTTKSTCGLPSSPAAVVCVLKSLPTGDVGCAIRAPASACSNVPQVETAKRCTSFTHCMDAADTDGNLLIAAPGDTGACSPWPLPTPRPIATPPGPFPTGPGGQRLAQLLNAYRVANGKPAHPLSRTMMATAGAHVADLAEHPEIDSGACVPHSWSHDGGLLWTGCCYTVNHAQADCMWRKPRELSAGLGLIPYTGNGYEIALRGFDGNTPEEVMQAFSASAPHRAVMLSTSGWEFLDTNPAMGAAMLGKYSVVWFGDASDPN